MTSHKSWDTNSSGQIANRISSCGKAGGEAGKFIGSYETAHDAAIRTCTQPPCKVPPPMYLLAKSACRQ